YLRSLLEKNPKLVIKPVDETSDKLYARVKIRKDSKDVDLARKLVESGMARTEETFDKEVAKKGRFAITYIPPSACQIYDHQKGSSLYVAENQARDSQEGMWKEEYWRKDIEERWREINKKRKEETTAQDIEAIKKKQLRHYFHYINMNV
ncbi:MAG: hypothetical protein HC820_05665, partial [Hydrococcus sp. RM1_1_31]|nr:hypothetical protein [Hydrococcus sp. RM1_1_31]